MGCVCGGDGMCDVCAVGMGCVMCVQWGCVGCLHMFSSTPLYPGFRGHDDEVLDLAFDSTGQQLVTASADGEFCACTVPHLVVVVVVVVYMCSGLGHQARREFTTLQHSIVCANCRGTRGRSPR